MQLFRLGQRKAAFHKTSQEDRHGEAEGQENYMPQAMDQDVQMNCYRCSQKHLSAEIRVCSHCQRNVCEGCIDQCIACEDYFCTGCSMIK